VLKRLAGESRGYLSYYVEAKTDRTNRSVQKASRSIPLATLGLVAVAGLIVIAIWLMLRGIAEGSVYSSR